MNLVDEAQSLMLYQFGNSPKLIGLMRALIEPIERAAIDIENLSDGAYISKASGSRIDILGRLVGQARQSMNDEEMLAWIKVRILLNHSQGTAENLLAILAVLCGPHPQVLINELKPNDVELIFLCALPAPSSTLFAIIQATAPVGTSCHFIQAEHKTAFRFDLTPFSSSQLAEFFKEDTL